MLPCIQGLILPVQASYDHEKFEQQLQFFHLKHYFGLWLLSPHSCATAQAEDTATSENIAARNWMPFYDPISALAIIILQVPWTISWDNRDPLARADWSFNFSCLLQDGWSDSDFFSWTSGEMRADYWGSANSVWHGNIGNCYPKFWWW